MRSVLAVVVGVLLAGCGPSDPNKVLGDGEVEVPVKQAFFKKFDLPIGGTYSLTVTPKSGDVDAWVEPGEGDPIVLYNEKGSHPRATVIAAGTTKELTGTLGWGRASAVIFNRGTQPVKAQVRLTIKPNPLK